MEMKPSKRDEGDSQLSFGRRGAEGAGEIPVQNWFSVARSR